MCNRPMRDSPSSPVAPVPSLPLPCAHDRLLPPRCGMSNLTCGSSYGSMLPTAPHRSFLTRISNLTPNDPCAPISRNPFLPNHSPFIDLSTKSLTARVVPPPVRSFPTPPLPLSFPLCFPSCACSVNRHHLFPIFHPAFKRPRVAFSYSWRFPADGTKKPPATGEPSPLPVFPPLRVSLPIIIFFCCSPLLTL